MRRTYVYGCALTLLGGSLGAAWMVRPAQMPLAPQVVAKATTAENQPNLPLSQVVLFSSGVGYFQREGEVDGNARVDLQFPVGDVNDLLKSLVLQDTGKGKIGIVSYDGLDPVDKTLRSFAVDLTGNPSFGELLNQARGEKVEVVMQSTAANQPGTITGVVMGMESQTQPQGPSAVHEVHMLNLVCAEGVRSVNLREVQRLRFLNSRMEGELRKALDVLATTHDSLKKQVSLNFKGEGKRKVKVGYVAENPIWKTSYRLSVDTAKDKPKVQLQGWAAIENVTDEDWNDVRVVLVSGRPISFQMDMYPPLFVPRPTVEPERFASLRPPGYEGAMTRDKVEDQLAALERAARPAPAMPAGIGGIGGIAGIGGIGGLPGMAGMGGIAGGGALGVNGVGTTNLGWQGNVGNVGFIGGFGGGQAGLGNQSGRSGNNSNRYQNVPKLRVQRRPGDGDDDTVIPADANDPRRRYDELLRRRQLAKEAKEQAKADGEEIANLQPHGKLASEAAAEDIGSHVRYVIDERVSLPRQKSALLPLLDKPIEATRVSIFNESVHHKSPVLGLRLKNTSGQTLTQGPVTVYEEGNYGGDARLPDLQPNEERLISYAIDLGVEVKAESRHTEGPAMTAEIIADKMHLHFTSRDTRKYTIRNRSTHDRLLVIEHPVRAGWDLAGPVKPRETSRDVYRFDVPVAAGQDLVFEVAEEQTRHEDYKGQSQLDKDGNHVTYFSSGLNLHVELTNHESPTELINGRLAKGTIIATSRLHVAQTYRVINTSTKEAREVTVRHRVGQGWSIVGEPPAANGVQSKEFRLKLEPGKDARAEVTNEREVVTETAGTMVSIAELERMQKHPAVSDAMKAAVTKVLDQRKAIEAQAAQITDVEKRLKEIAEEQDRLRKNLVNLPPTSAAHKRYLEKFDKQETEIEGLQEQKKKLKAVEQTKQKELADLLATLSAE